MLIRGAEFAEMAQLIISLSIYANEYMQRNACGLLTNLVHSTMKEAADIPKLNYGSFNILRITPCLQGIG